MEGEEEPVANGEVSSEDGSDKGTRKTDIIIITGKPEKCEAARKALLVSLLECWLTVSVDYISRVDLYSQKRLSLHCLGNSPHPHVFFFLVVFQYFIVPCGKLGSPQVWCTICKSSATHSYQWVQYFSVSKQQYGCLRLGFLTCTQMYRQCKRDLTGFWHWKKNPLPHQRLEPASMSCQGFQSVTWPLQPQTVILMLGTKTEQWPPCIPHELKCSKGATYGWFWTEPSKYVLTHVKLMMRHVSCSWLKQITHLNAHSNSDHCASFQLTQHPKVIRLKAW